ncbi:putative membrane protein [Campylobacter hyointestinalis subsp. lawsonii CCUG 27631]|uniref:hypothetical protein n=1 Tax=Campylobacter hyointestinalis TaxID=198 RepID=UPI0007C95A5E|nr:hypothetical protein [Campylobacter hyointestinalis]ANE33720.1 putative membrane protein [Campylobacter hyointestinalis subsp. lawsonii CCUG 27631]
MKARRYILYSILYVALVWVLVFTFFNGRFTISVFEYSIDLPIASWVILPIGLFALLSILHMSYYGFKNFLDARAVRSDLQLYNILAKEIFLGLESNKEFKTDLFLNPSEATKALSPWLNLGEPKFNNDDLKLAYETSQKIKNGEVCEIKKVKLLKTNPLFIQNEKNKIKADYKYALSILSAKGDINESLYKEAYNALIEYGTYLEISKFNLKYSNEDIIKLINRYVEDKNFEIATSDLFNIINKNQFECEEYIKMAINLKTKVAPDKLIGIFDKLRNEHLNASEAYLYLLYDFQMIEELREALASSQNDDFDRLKTLMFLRDNGKMISADIFYK